MTTQYTLRGSVPLNPGYEADFINLLAMLDVDDYDEVSIKGGTLYINISGADVPYSFCPAADAAVENFCRQHAAEGAVFQQSPDYDAAIMVVGPTPQARHMGHLAYCVALRDAAQAELTRVLGLQATDYAREGEV